ncbi:MAG TPA: hypothetical protein VFV23_12510 [Verrucomicrobiae bacterium]|nr:hypothetical protein [Verrucomicrobiae bacterium]
MNAVPPNLDAPMAEAKLNEAPLEAVRWSKTRWFALIVFAFAAYVAFIIAAGERGQIIPRPVKNIPRLKLVAGENELLSLNDPTLFALPHPHDFSAPVWQQMPQAQQPSFRWSEPPRWLPLTENQLGAVFQNFVRTNFVSSIRLEFKPPPEFSRTKPPAEPVVRQRSTLRITGDLAQRSLLSDVVLPSLPGNDVLEPTKIQLLVGADGNVLSVVPLESSGSGAADQIAIKNARMARFTAAAAPTIGRMIFDWHTVPLTNDVKSPMVQ